MYQLDDAGAALCADARGIAQSIAQTHAADVDDKGRFPVEAIDTLRQQGFFGLALPTDFGGRAQPPRVFAAAVEELAQACASTAMVYVMHVTAAQAILVSETLDGRDELLGQIADGQHLTTLAFSERGSRSQFWAPVSKLEQNGAGFVTSAYKSWVTSANHADSYVCSAQRPDSESPLDSTLYLLRRDAQGTRIDGEFEGLGLRGNDSAPVVIESVKVGEGDLLTEQGGGAAAMLEVVLPWFVVGTAAMANGLCRAASSATAAHLTSTGFETDGTMLRDLPNLRVRLAKMNVRTEQSRALLAFTVGEMEQPNEQTPLYVLQSRVAALEATLEVTDLAMKACGGAAFSKHLAVERIFRDARAGCIMAPTIDHLHEFIGRALTGLPLF